MCSTDGQGLQLSHDERGDVPACASACVADPPDQGKARSQVAAIRYEAAIRRPSDWKAARSRCSTWCCWAWVKTKHGFAVSAHRCAERIGTDCLYPRNYVPQKGTWRITLTMPVINWAREVAFLIEGTAKAQTVQDVSAWAYDPEEKPVQLIRPASGRLDLSPWMQRRL